MQVRTNSGKHPRNHHTKSPTKPGNFWAAFPSPLNTKRDFIPAQFAPINNKRARSLSPLVLAILMRFGHNWGLYEWLIGSESDNIPFDVYKVYTVIIVGLTANDHMRARFAIVFVPSWIFYRQLGSACVGWSLFFVGSVVIVMVMVWGWFGFFFLNIRLVFW